MAIRYRGRIAVAAVAVLLLGVFVPPFVNLNRYKARIATSIGNALGRKTTVGSVSLRLLPQPGFDLSDVNVADDPAFGAEPMLHADEVTANLRLTSLWRGRLEIAKLSLQYPSLNMVRAADGKWNIETLLERASRIPTAPTAKTRPGMRPRFPYIEADSGRINFKIGPEKKVYSLADADFSLWMESENEVRTRLRARMVRTDSYLSDTGTLRLEGRFQRAWNLRDTPLSVTASLDNAQLGQLTKLIDGLDRGWRGGVDVDLNLGGTPSNMNVSARAAINDFRRYDITTTNHLRLETRCAAKFSASEERFWDISCQSPVSGGALSLRGSLDGIATVRGYDLTLASDKVPVQSFVAALRHWKLNLPEDLNAAGTVDGSFVFRKPDAASSAVWDGSAKTSDVVLSSSLLPKPLPVGIIGVELRSASVHGNKQARIASEPQAKDKAPGAYRLALLPVLVGVSSGPNPLAVAGNFDLHGYDVRVNGETEIPQLFQLARVAGVRAPQVDADGLAKVDLDVAGKWAEWVTPRPTGNAAVRNVTVRMKGVAAPLQIAAADFLLDNDSVRVSNIAASFAKAHVALSGSVRLPRQCQSIETCPVRFDLKSDQLATDDVNRLLNPRLAKRPWYDILGSSPPSIFAILNATGRISVGKLTIKALTATHVFADAHLEAGKLELSNVLAELWGGKHTGQWTADFTQKLPVYSGSGTIDAFPVSGLMALAKENWGTGSVRASYKASMNGLTASDLLASADANVDFDWHRGSLRNLALNGTNAPLSFTRFTGTIAFHNGQWQFAPGSAMTASSGTYEISGTATVNRQVDFKFRNGKHGYAVTGTMEKPKVILERAATNTSKPTVR
jgi:AsmA family/AsmA-like C-terminal region